MSVPQAMNQSFRGDLHLYDRTLEISRTPRAGKKLGIVYCSSLPFRPVFFCCFFYLSSQFGCGLGRPNETTRSDNKGERSEENRTRRRFAENFWEASTRCWDPEMRGGVRGARGRACCAGVCERSACLWRVGRRRDPSAETRGGGR